MRECKNCQKPIDNLHKNREFCSDKCRDKFRYERCGQRSTPEQRKKWYLNRLKAKGYRDKLRQQGQRRNNEIQEFLREYKLKNGCADCGYKEHHAALEFDHVRGKKMINVCNAKSIAQAENEIEKCEVVCAIHHRIRTFNRLQK